MGTADKIAASGGTAPASQEQAVTLYSEVTDILFETIETEGFQDPSASDRSVRYADSGEGVINWNGTYGTGNVAISGTYKYNTEYPDTFLAWAFGQVYPNTTFTVKSMTDVNMGGKINTITLTHLGESYIVSASLVEDMYSNTTVNYVTDSTGGTATATATGVYDLDLVYGLALSVKRTSDGVGAKYIISLSASGSGSVVNEDDKANIVSVGTLKVYDDTNTLIYSVALDSDDISM